MPKVTIEPHNRGLFQSTGSGLVLASKSLDIAAGASDVPHTAALIIGDHSATNAGGADAATFDTSTTPTEGTVVIVVNTSATSGVLESQALAQNDPVVFIYANGGWRTIVSA